MDRIEPAANLLLMLVKKQVGWVCGPSVITKQWPSSNLRQLLSQIQIGSCFIKIFFWNVDTGGVVLLSKHVSLGVSCWHATVHSLDQFGTHAPFQLGWLGKRAAGELIKIVTGVDGFVLCLQKLGKLVVLSQKWCWIKIELRQIKWLLNEGFCIMTTNWRWHRSDWCR